MIQRVRSLDLPTITITVTNHLFITIVLPSITSPSPSIAMIAILIIVTGGIILTTIIILSHHHHRLCHHRLCHHPLLHRLHMDELTVPEVLRVLVSVLVLKKGALRDLRADLAATIHQCRAHQDDVSVCM